MKFKKILGLALSAAMAVSAVVPWTGVTALAADYPETDKELDVYMNPNNYGKGGYFVHVAKAIFMKTKCIQNLNIIML